MAGLVNSAIKEIKIMLGKRILIGAACLMAMQGAMAQVDGVTGASVQTANTSCCKSKSNVAILRQSN